MSEKLYSLFDSKTKFFQVSEDELKKLYSYVFDGLKGFDYLEAKRLFKLIMSRQPQYDVKSWQFVCKYCPLYLRCDVPIGDVVNCTLYNKLPVRKYASYAMDEIQYQRQRLSDIFKNGKCDNNCGMCILCQNDGKCMLVVEADREPDGKIIWL